MDTSARLTQWRRHRNHLAIGNLGEQVTARLLLLLGYQLLGAQDDFVGMVPEVLGLHTKANPEDFIAVNPDGQLVTVNSKASLSNRTCRILNSGNLSTPRLARGQNRSDYSTLRAQLITPLDGGSFAQVVKVDLLHMKAQVFAVADGGNTAAIGCPQDIAAMLTRSSPPSRTPCPRPMCGTWFEPANRPFRARSCAGRSPCNLQPPRRLQSLRGSMWHHRFRRRPDGPPPIMPRYVGAGAPHLRYLIGPQVFPRCQFRRLPRIPSMLPGPTVFPGGCRRLGTTAPPCRGWLRSMRVRRGGACMPGGPGGFGWCRR
jgi:hypothetical protein